MSNERSDPVVETGAATQEMGNQSEQSSHSHGEQEGARLDDDEQRERHSPEEQEATIRRLQMHGWRQRLKGRQSMKDLAEELIQQLHTASEALLDCLFHYLSGLPEEDQDERAHKSPIHGLTLPASAVGWISSQLFSNESTGIHNEPSLDRSMLSVSMRDRVSLLRFLLPRATHIRLTNDPWPAVQSKGRKGRGETQVSAFNGDDEDAIHSFLEYYDRLLHRPNIDMRVFPNAKVVLLDQVPTCWIVHLNAVRHSLQVLRVERSAIFDLPSVLCSEQQDTESRPPEDSTDDPLSAPSQDIEIDRNYSKLTHVKLCQCSLNEKSGLRGRLRDDGTRDDPPLQRLSYLQSLCLAHNEIATEASALAGLSNMPFLAKLDLSFNRISSLKTAHHRLGNLQTLVLSHNQLRSVQGIDRLYALETLWLDHNRIADLADVSGLARLPELKSLKLKGNPFQQNRRKAYRVSVLDLFRECRLASLPPGVTFRQLQQVLPVLDDKPASLKELKAMRGRTFRGLSSGPSTAHAETDVETDGEAHEESASDDVREVSAAPDNPTPIQRRSKRRVARIGLEYSALTVPAATAETPGSSGPAPAVFTVLDVLHSISEPKAAEAKEETAEPVEEASMGPEKEAVVENSPDESIEQTREADQDVGQVSELNASPFDEAAQPKIAAIEYTEEAGTFKPENNVDEEFGEKDTNLTYAKEQEVDAHKPSDVMEPVRDDLQEETAADKPEDDKSTSGASNTPMEKELSDSKRAEDKDDNTDLHHLSISPIKLNGSIQDAHELKASAATATTTDTNLEPNDYPLTPAKKETPVRKLDAAAEKEASEFLDLSETPSTPGTPSPAKLALRVVSFPDNVWQDDNISVPSSIATPHRDDVSGPNKYQLAEANSKYTGPDIYRKLLIHENLELYFRLFVFAASPSDDSLSPSTLALKSEEEEWQTILEKYPKIQLWSIDRRMRDAAESEKAQLAVKPDSREEFRRVWRDNIVGCGKPALRRLTPNRGARYGFHGELLWSAAHTSHLKPETVAEARAVIICFSDTAMYIILDHDSVTIKTREQKKKKFPLPIAHDACFGDVRWPHALARHPFHTLRAITIGFGFQRLTLRFSNSFFPSPDDFTYILLTSNKMETVGLLKELQELANEARERAGMAGLTEDGITIENDDRHVLDALGVAVAPDIIGVILHYQILQQRWKNGERGAVRRVCVVTDAKLFLLDEDYVGDGSESMEAGTRALGETVYRLVDSADLPQIVKVQAADADPSAITIVIRPLSRLQRIHNWRLRCRDRTGAERLVEDVRKAMSLLE